MMGSNDSTSTGAAAARVAVGEFTHNSAEVHIEKALGISCEEFRKKGWLLHDRCRMPGSGAALDRY